MATWDMENLEKLDLNRLHEFAERARKPKWERAAHYVTELAEQEKSEYEELA